jgi:hypothetical protein
MGLGTAEGVADPKAADYIVREDNRAVGRIYQDRHTLPGLRWFVVYH